jgi:hypothetical protein
MRLSIVLLLSALVGCGASDSLVGVARRIDGAWTLESMNGSPLPAAPADGVETLSSQFVADNGSFKITSVVRVTGTSTELTTLQSGHYYCGHAGCAPMLLIFEGSGANADVVVTDTTLTVYGPGATQVYRRE